MNKPLKIDTLKNLALRLGIRTNTLHYYAFGVGRNNYTTFKVAKRSSGYRTLAAPSHNLKLIQRRVLSLLTPYYSPIDSVHGIAKKGVVKNASVHLKTPSVLHIDLQDFFPSVSAGRIWGLFKGSSSFEFAPGVAKALCNITTYQEQLPQGAPTSPLLANMVCWRLDKRLRLFSNTHNMNYTRYFDDMTFSLKETTSSFEKCGIVKYPNRYELRSDSPLRRIIEEEGFLINESKLRIQSAHRAQYVTGVKVNQKLNVDRRYIKRIRAILHDWDKNGYKVAENKFIAKYGANSLRTSVRGMIEYVRQVRRDNSHDDKVFLALLNQYNELVSKSKSKRKTI